MALDIKLIRASFENVKPIASDVADKFYEILWKDYPGSDQLFVKTDMTSQKKLLIKSLVFIVENLDHSDRLVAYLKGMGGRHVGYGAEEEHYIWVGASLLKTFAFFFKDQWTQELKEQWGEACQFIAETMIEGGREAVKSKGSAKDKNVLSLHKGQHDADQIELPSVVLEQIRARAKESVQQAIQDEFDRAVSEELKQIDTSSLSSTKKRANSK